MAVQFKWSWSFDAMRFNSSLVWKAISGAIETITGSVPLVLTNALKNSLKNLTQYGKVEQASTPTPASPQDIICNNGILKYGYHDIITTSSLSGYGTYVSPTSSASNRAYIWLKDLLEGTYTFSVDGNYEIIVQWRDPADPNDGAAQYYENLSAWMTSGEVTLNKTSGGYGIAVRRTNGSSITPDNFDGTLHVQEKGVYVDGTPEVLTVSGANLCAPAYDTGEGWYIASSNQVANASSNGTLVFPCKPNTTYSWWHTNGKGGERAFELTTDTVTLGQEATWAVGNPAYNDAMTVRKYTTSANAKLLCVLFARVDAEKVGRTKEEQFADFMLVEGDIEEAFAYQPYHEPQTVTNIPALLSVGDYKDEVEIISGLLTHRIGVKVLDGTESGWALSDSGSTHRFRDVKPKDSRTPASRAPIVSTHFVYVSAGQTLGGAFIGASQYWYFIPTDQTIETADGWKAWLAAQYAAGTPVIVLYPLATETQESVTAQHLQILKGTNVVDVEANVSDIQLEAIYIKTT